VARRHDPQVSAHEIDRVFLPYATGLYVMHPNDGLDVVQSDPDSQAFRRGLSAWRGHRKDVEPALKSMRMVKDQQEMALIRKAVDASVAGHLAAMRAVRPGRHEYEIAALMQYELQMRGCERLPYPAIVASGNHSPTPIMMRIPARWEMVTWFSSMLAGNTRSMLPTLLVPRKVRKLKIDGLSSAISGFPPHEVL
jgi:hypothetical protein